jgi:hypothetical protein
MQLQLGYSSAPRPTMLTKPPLTKLSRLLRDPPQPPDSPPPSTPPHSRLLCLLLFLLPTPPPPPPPRTGEGVEQRLESDARGEACSCVEEPPEESNEYRDEVLWLGCGRERDKRCCSSSAGMLMGRVEEECRGPAAAAAAPPPTPLVATPPPPPPPLRVCPFPPLPLWPLAPLLSRGAAASSHRQSRLLSIVILLLLNISSDTPSQQFLEKKLVRRLRMPRVGDISPPPWWCAAPTSEEDLRSICVPLRRRDAAVRVRERSGALKGRAVTF